VPFQADSDYELMRAQVEQQPLPPREVKGEIPVAVEAAILQALAKDPAARFQSAAEFRSALISAIPAAALKPEPIHQAEAEPALKATRIAGSEEEWQSFDRPLQDPPPRRDSGFDRNTGTFTLKLPSFVLTARQSLEAKVGPLNWKHYSGAAAAMLVFAFGLFSLRREQPPQPEPPQPIVVLPTATPQPVQPTPEVPVVVPSVAPSAEEANVRPDPKAVTEEKSQPRANPASTATPKPTRPQVANNDRSPSAVKPTPTPTPAQQAQATPKPGKLDKALDTTKKVAETAGAIKDAANKLNPFRRKN
jgi:serine/threonine-protein kinase